MKCYVHTQSEIDATTEGMMLLSTASAGLCLLILHARRTLRLCLVGVIMVVAGMLSVAQTIPVYYPEVWQHSESDTVGGVICYDEFTNGHTLDDSSWVVMSSNRRSDNPDRHVGEVVILSSVDGRTLIRDSLCPAVFALGYESILWVSMPDSANLICYTCHGSGAHLREYPSLKPVSAPSLDSRGFAMISHTGRYLVSLPSTPEYGNGPPTSWDVAVLHDRYTGDTVSFRVAWDHRVSFSRDDRYFVASALVNVGSYQLRPYVFDLSRWEFLGDALEPDPMFEGNPPRIININGGSADFMFSDDAKTLIVTSGGGYGLGINDRARCIRIDLATGTKLSDIPLHGYGSFSKPDMFNYEVSIDSSARSFYVRQPTSNGDAGDLQFDWFRYSVGVDTPQVHFKGMLTEGRQLRQTSDSRIYRFYDHTVAAYDMDLPTTVHDETIRIVASYPNPADGHVTIPLSPTSEAGIDISIVEVATGTTMRQFHSAGTGLITIDTRELSSGIYAIVCRSPKGLVLSSTQLIIRH